MMYLNNILALVASDNNNVFYIIVVISVLLSLLIFSLIYSQNKEIKEFIKHKQNKEEALVENEPFNVYQESNIFEEAKLIEDKKDTIESSEIPEEPKLVELTDMTIPDKLEYTQALWQNDFLDLESISKEIENTQKDIKINMTPFEEEQEEKAIISYDELLNRAETIDSYHEQVNLSDLKKKSKQDIEQSRSSYEHEESFLQDLKELRDSLI